MKLSQKLSYGLEIQSRPSFQLGHPNCFGDCVKAEIRPYYKGEENHQNTYPLDLQPKEHS